MHLLIITTAQAVYHRLLQEQVAICMREDGGCCTVVMLDRQREGTAVFKPELVYPRGANLVHILIPPTRLLSVNASKIPSIKLAAIVKSAKPDVIWIHEYSPFVWTAYWGAWVRRVPIIVSTEIGESNRKRLGLAQRASRWVWGRRVSGIIAHSPAALVPIEPVAREKVVRAFYAVRASDYRPSTNFPQRAPGPLRLVFLGQMIQRKGLDLFFSALKRAEETGTVFQVILIGKANPWLQCQIERANLKSEIVLMGFLEGEPLKEAMRKGDAFVLPSRFDTYGAVTHEAACLGLALLISRSAGSSILVEEGKNGWTIDPEDSETFSDRMVQLSRHPNLLREMRLAARATGKQTDVVENGRRIYELLRRILSVPHSQLSLPCLP